MADVRDFQKDVIEQSFEKPVLVDFWASWCQPCKILGPIIEKVALDYADRLALIKVNTEIYQDIATKYHIRSIPTVKLFINGEVADEFMGALPEIQIRQWLDERLPHPFADLIQKVEIALKKQNYEEAEKEAEILLEKDAKQENTLILAGKAFLKNSPEKSLDVLSKISQHSKLHLEASALQKFAQRINEEIPESFDGDANLVRKYRSGIFSLKQFEFETALKCFIDVMMIDRKIDDDGARLLTLGSFYYLGKDHETTKKFRPRFDMALY